MEIRIPNLSEGVNSGTVVSVLVAVGDKIQKDQSVLELETEKAVAPIPSPEAGTVSKIHVKEGDKVSIGQLILTLEGAGAGTSPKPETPPAAAPAPQASPAPPATPAPSGDYRYQSKSGFPPPASPSVKKMARQLGIDLARVRGSQRGGRIVLKDLRDYIGRLQSGGASAAPGSAPGPAKPSIDFSQWGAVTKKAVSSLRGTIARRMQESWTTVPHVTQFDEADITELLKLRKQALPKYEKKGVRLTVTTFLIKAVLDALKQYPIFNASLDETTGEIVYKKYRHIGVAVDTEAGLIVPVIRDADKKDLVTASKELAALAEKARKRKVSLEELQGGSFTISNLGGIGGTYFTPIVNKPEVAILGVGKGVTRLVPDGKKVSSRVFLPLGVSYDHRVIDGADGARFIRAVVESLEKMTLKDLGVK